VSVFLVGGGVDSVETAGLFDPYLAELRAHAEGRERAPRLAIAVFDHEGSGDAYLPGYVEALRAAEPVDIVPVRVRRRQAVAPDAFADVDGITVGGGPTPEYLAGLVGCAGTIRAAVAAGAPYLGFSAGAMIAPDAALLGGYRVAGHEVCPQEWSEGLAEVMVRPGLGLVRFAVDVHAAQAGTLGRAVAVVESGATAAAVAIDEGTCLTVRGPDTAETYSVTGIGNAWFVTPGAAVDRSVTVTRRPMSAEPFPMAAATHV
jgi:cyanophycinase